MFHIVLGSVPVIIIILKLRQVLLWSDFILILRAAAFHPPPRTLHLRLSLSYISDGFPEFFSRQLPHFYHWQLYAAGTSPLSVTNKEVL
jgi:hypothetical protein